MFHVHCATIFLAHAARPPRPVACSIFLAFAARPWHGQAHGMAKRIYIYIFITCGSSKLDSGTCPHIFSTVSQIVGFLGRYAPFQSAVGECVLASTFFLSCWPAATAKSVVGAATNWLIGSRHSWLVGNLTRYLKVGRAHTMTLGTSTTTIVSTERFSGPDRRPQRLMISRIQACHQSTALQPRLPQPMCLKQLWAGTMVSHGAGDAGKGPWLPFRSVAALARWKGPATWGLGIGTPFAAVARSAATAPPMEARGATAAPLGILPMENFGFAVIVALIAWLCSYWKNKELPRGRLSG